MHLEADIRALLEAIPDPEIPVITIGDLGIIREIVISDSSEPSFVNITPTYSGCPATDVISMQAKMKLLEHGYNDVIVRQVLSPPWTTDWISDEGKRKLKAYGIAPPQGNVNKNVLDPKRRKIICPFCDSTETEMISNFGSTPCKALYRCTSCLEPFDYFKCH